MSGIRKRIYDWLIGGKVYHFLQKSTKALKRKDKSEYGTLFKNAQEDRSGNTRFILQHQMSSLNRYSFEFDERISCGSKEHFFHFMWGYLLPSLHTIQKLEPSADMQFVFRSCGPIMNMIIAEVMDMFQYPYLIDSTEGEVTKILVPRWDIGILHTHIFDPDNTQHRIMQYLNDSPTLYGLYSKTNFLRDLETAIGQVKVRFMEVIDVLDYPSDLSTYAGCYLILTRSSEPSFYAKGGPAEISGYGTSRRSLTGIDQVRQELQHKNIPVQIFEPGKHSLIEQINVFNRSLGVIGIKGAEFANMIWMRPNTRVVLISMKNKNLDPFQRELANILKLKYFEIENDQGDFPILTTEMIEKYLV